MIYLLAHLRHKPSGLQLWRCDSISAGLLSLPLEFRNAKCDWPPGAERTVRTAAVRLSKPVRLLRVLEWGRHDPLHWHQAQGGAGIRMLRWKGNKCVITPQYSVVTCVFDCAAVGRPTSGHGQASTVTLVCDRSRFLETKPAEQVGVVSSVCEQWRAV